MVIRVKALMNWSCPHVANCANAKRVTADNANSIYQRQHSKGAIASQPTGVMFASIGGTNKQTYRSTLQANPSRHQSIRPIGTVPHSCSTIGLINRAQHTAMTLLHSMVPTFETNVLILIPIYAVQPIYIDISNNDCVGTKGKNK